MHKCKRWADEEADGSGKRKHDSVVDKLTKKPKGNTIRTTAGFMVVEKDGENEEDLENEEIPEKQMKLKRRKLSERLQDPIRVKERSKQVKVNSFRTQTLTHHHHHHHYDHRVLQGQKNIVIIINNNNNQCIGKAHCTKAVWISLQNTLNGKTHRGIHGKTHSTHSG